MPSSGVKPIVVSTDRPSTTAQSDAPLPRWQVTVRALPGSPATVGPRAAAQACERPWNPNRSRCHRSRHERGRAYVRAACGRVEWNDVSKHATCGVSGNACRAAESADRTEERGGGEGGGSKC